MTEERDQVHLTRRRAFAFTLIILEIIVLILYGLFVRPNVHNDIDVNHNYYPAYQDVNVMMLIGFGFLMTFIKTHAWSALAYTFFINAIVVQYYILLSSFWARVFKGGWNDTTISIQENNFTGGSYCVAAMLIAFGGLLGKVGPFQLLIMAVLGVVGYTLNQGIVYEVLGGLDAGGSTAIHTFGAYYGLTISFILSKKVKPIRAPQTSYMNTTIAMIGTLFLWMFWPSFNAGYFPQTGFEKTLIINNTILSLTASCLAAFIGSAFLRDKFSMEDILNATLAGGVVVGAPSGVALNPAAVLTIGLIAGSLSTFGYVKITKFLEQKIGLYDTCGINNLHGMPGLLGGIFSAIIIAAYQSDAIPAQFSSLGFNPITHQRNFSGQAGIQIAITFISLGIGICSGIIVGFILYAIYNFEAVQFFDDRVYFETPEEEKLQFIPDRLPQKAKLPPIGKPSGSQIHLV